jgi:hypothetical protein
MSDTTSIDLARFFERYDTRNRLVFVAAISASLVMSAVIFAHGPATTLGLTATKAESTWWYGVMFSPLFIAGWWTFGELVAFGRRKGKPPAGPLPTAAVDVSNGVRIANAGFAFNVAVTVTVVVSQALMVFFVFGYPVAAGEWIARATMLAVGAVTIYLGNLWPRMPVPRVADRTAAVRMKVNRASGWIMVGCGLMVILLGLFMPYLQHHLVPFLQRHHA